MNNIKKIISLSALLFTCLVIFLFWSWFSSQADEDSVFLVENGSSLSKMANQLREKNIISNKKTFVLLARFRRDTRNIHSGEYKITKGMSQNEILSMLVSGKVITYPLTLLEGWSFTQFKDELRKATKLKQTLPEISNIQLMKILGNEKLHPEGSFYPDTYLYTAGSTDVSILKKAFNKMQASLDKQWENRESNLPYKSKYEALIMASIVEKETGKAEERPLIAGVFVNRLRKKMKLQTDPTVIYGMGDRFKGNIRRKDLRKDTPYNTYTRYGLPPTPIAMPSEAAIYAALHPEKTKAIFFVSRGDGSHVFSETLKQHNQAVRKYQLKK